MQENNTDNHRFFQRAKKLQENLGFVSDEQLAEAIGISPKTYYSAIKSAKITDKTWRKLEAAEKTAGLVEKRGVDSTRGINYSQKSPANINPAAQIKEERAGYKVLPGVFSRDELKRELEEIKDLAKLLNRKIERFEEKI